MIRELHRPRGASEQRINELIRTVNTLQRRNPQEIIRRTLQQVPYRKGGTGTGGDPTIWAEVIRGPQMPDPDGEPSEGYSDYVLRLETSNYPTWSAQVYPENSLVVKDTRLYKSNTETTDSWVEEEWDLQDEINPKHIESGTVDWRRYIPWPVVGAVVPLIKKGEAYYFAQQMIRVQGAIGTHQSLIWNEDDDRAMAVFA